LEGGGGALSFYGGAPEKGVGAVAGFPLGPKNRISWGAPGGTAGPPNLVKGLGKKGLGTKKALWLARGGGAGGGDRKCFFTGPVFRLCSVVEKGAKFHRGQRKTPETSKNKKKKPGNFFRGGGVAGGPKKKGGGRFFLAPCRQGPQELYAFARVPVLNRGLFGVGNKGKPKPPPLQKKKRGGGGLNGACFWGFLPGGPGGVLGGFRLENSAKKMGRKKGGGFFRLEGKRGGFLARGGGGEQGKGKGGESRGGQFAIWGAGKLRVFFFFGPSLDPQMGLVKPGKGGPGVSPTLLQKGPGGTKPLGPFFFRGGGGGGGRGWGTWKLGPLSGT